MEAIIRRLMETVPPKPSTELRDFPQEIINNKASSYKKRICEIFATVWSYPRPKTIQKDKVKWIMRKEFLPVPWELRDNYAYLLRAANNGDFLVKIVCELDNYTSNISYLLDISNGHPQEALIKKYLCEEIGILESARQIALDYINEWIIETTIEQKKLLNACMVPGVKCDNKQIENMLITNKEKLRGKTAWAKNIREHLKKSEPTGKKLSVSEKYVDNITDNLKKAENDIDALMKKLGIEKDTHSTERLREIEREIDEIMEENKT
jgi:hypothetical protein